MNQESRFNLGGSSQGHLCACMCVCVCVCVCVYAQSCPTLCDPIDCRPPGSSVHGIFQARILEQVAISSSRDLPDPEVKPLFPESSALAGEYFHHCTTWEAPKTAAEVLANLSS